MKLFLILALFFASRAFAALVPETLANTFYRETGVAAGIRFKWEFMIHFVDQSHYRYFKYAKGSTVASGQPIELQITPADGTYVYARTGDNTATVTLNEAGGTLYDFGIRTTSLVLELRFATDSTGENLKPWPASAWFALVPARLAQAALVLNVSMRGKVAAGQPAIVGFVIPGDVREFVGRDVLIRVLGPSLTQFGIARPWVDPDFEVYHGPFRGPIGAHFGDVPPEGAPHLARIFSLAGAFPLMPGVKDAVAVVRLVPGAYTVVCEPAASDEGGEALVEVYFLP